MQVILPGQQGADHIRGQPTDRGNGQVDVPRQDNEHLPHRDHQRNRQAGGQTIDAAGIEIVLNLERKECQEPNHDQEEDDLPELLRPNASQQGTSHGGLPPRAILH